MVYINFDYMDTHSPEYFKRFFDNIIGNENWAIGGFTAIDFYCTKFNIQLLNDMPNNYDNVYSAMTPITNSKLFEYERMQSSPRSSMTFTLSEAVPLNLTMSRSSIKYFEIDGLKCLTPTTLLDWYNDIPEDQQTQLVKNKIFLLKYINSLINPSEYQFINMPLRTTVTHTISPLSKRRLIMQ